MSGQFIPFKGSRCQWSSGVVFWLGWHVIQSRRETKHMEEVMKMGDPEKIAKMLDRY